MFWPTSRSPAVGWQPETYVKLSKSASRNKFPNCQRDLAQSVYTTLAQKVKETQISAQGISGSVRLAGSAVVPERPLSRGRLTYTALGLVLGLLVVMGGVFAVEYFREPAKVDPGLRPEPDSVEELLDDRGHAELRTG
jgi:hypothetical protein